MEVDRRCELLVRHRKVDGHGERLIITFQFHFISLLWAALLSLTPLSRAAVSLHCKRHDIKTN